MHVRTGRQKHGTTLSCCIDLHNDDFFGLTLIDLMKLFNETQTKYKKPSNTDINKNSAHIKWVQGTQDVGGYQGRFVI